MKAIKKVLSLLFLCSSILFFSNNINAQCNLTLTATQTSDGPNYHDASVFLTATGGSGSYVYYNGSQTVNNLTAGNGTFWVEDTTLSSCTDTITITITDTINCQNFNSQLYHYDSCGTNDVHIIISLGAPGNYSSQYTYLWNTGATSDQIHNGTTGTYSVIINDINNNCTSYDTITVVDDTCGPCQGFNVQIYDSCTGQSGSILHTNMYGNQYTYSWSTGDSTHVLDDQNPGTYSVTVTNTTTGCIDSTTKTIACDPCTNFSGYIQANDGSGVNDLSLSARSAYPLNLSFLWSNGATSQSIYGLSSGTYSVTITDTINGCSDTVAGYYYDSTYNPCQSFNVHITEYDTCTKTGVQLYSNYWGAQYSYQWSTGDRTYVINNQPTGSYWVVVTNSNNGCIDTGYITVVDDTCNTCDSFYGYIQANDSNGTNDLTLTAWTVTQSNLSYFWNTGATTQSISGQTSGNYWVIITDTVNGCKDTASGYYYDSTHNPCSNFKVFLNSYDNCKQSDVVIYSSYHQSANYNWSNGSTTRNLSGVSSGTYSLTISDTINNCSDSATITVTDSVYKCCRASIYTSGTGATKNFYGYNNNMDSSGTTYNWNYGDGNTGSGANTSHTYTTMGSKTVCLYIEDSVGCKDTACKTVIAPPPGKNLKVTHYGQPYILDTTRYIYIFYSNIGTTTETATIEYYMPDSVTYSSSTITPTTNSGNKLTFNIGSLTPNQSGFVKVFMTTPSTFTLGSIKCDTSKILTLTGDIDVSNNTSIVCDSVVGSYDPNDKTPYPKGLGKNGNIDPETKEISYLIRFQNEGNWRTYRVRVEDEIDPSFDISSLIIGDYSHDARLVVDGNKLVWYFDDIHLTPKSENEEKSQGYIQYSLKLKENLPLGTQIKNTAYIYFDKNPAIITNTTVNTLKLDESTASINDMRSGDYDFNILNSESEINVVSEKSMKAISIYDINGRLIHMSIDKTKEYKIDKSQFSKNIYIFQVKIDDKIVVKKLQL